MELKFDDVKIGDIVCLNHYPYKPFRVENKTNHYDNEPSVLLCPHNDTRISYKWFTKKMFEESGYIKFSEKLYA